MENHMQAFKASPSQYCMPLSPHFFVSTIHVLSPMVSRTEVYKSPLEGIQKGDKTKNLLTTLQGTTLPCSKLIPKSADTSFCSAQLFPFYYIIFS